MPLQGPVLRRVLRQPGQTTAAGKRDSEPTQSQLLRGADLAGRSWRFCVLWLARVAIPVLLLWSNVRVLTIPQRSLPLEHTSALLIMTHSRHTYLSRCLASVLQHHPGGEGWPVIVSQDRQDGLEHSEVAEVGLDAAAQADRLGVDLHAWAHESLYKQDVPRGRNFVNNFAYRRISRHYQWALTRVFAEGLPGRPPLDRVIIVEDDMEVAPDFFSYFSALAPMLDADDSLLCISAWNDNGIESLARDPRQLHRTDFFPGLGWMLTRSLWEELEPKWPKMFWDDWMRSTNQTRGRQCIRPEVSRTANFGAEGVPQSFHFERYVSKVVLAKDAVDFSQLNLSYLEPERYHDYIFSRMSNAVQLKFSNYLTSKPQNADVIAYYPEEQLGAIGRRTGIMVDDRHGFRRTSYKGVIVFPWNDHWAFVVPQGWKPPEGYRMGSSVCC